MITTFVKHAVKDYAAWRSVYDNFLPIAKTKGVVKEHVYQDKNSSDTIIVTHQFQSVQEANEFFNSGELRKAMESAGVLGSPEIWFGEELKPEVH